MDAPAAVRGETSVAEPIHREGWGTLDPDLKTEMEGTPPVHEAEVKALTITQAKNGLSLTFNVPPEVIEITIRG